MAKSVLKTDAVQFVRSARAAGLRIFFAGFLICGVGFVGSYFGLLRAPIGIGLVAVGWLIGTAGLVYFFFGRGKKGSEKLME